MLKGVFNYFYYLFRKDKDKGFYFKLIALLGFLPANISLYKIALTHKSASSGTTNGKKINNERLEYLGDAILGAIATEYIYREFKHEDEGYMTKLRARIVKRKHLNSAAQKMGIHMLISSHPHPATVSKHLCGNALEALIGAIYLDQGFKQTARFFRNRMMKRFVDLENLARKDTDYKSQLIEWAQKKKKEVEFFTHEEYDPGSKSPVFESQVKVEQSDAGTGKGGSKKEAEQQAAKVALKTISK